MPGKISSDFIQELLSRVDIVNVINTRVPLTKSGREFKACCPFHNERTPSFYVTPAKQFYHCFGCGESGTAISFLMKYSNMQFRETIEELASSAGMEIPVDQFRAPVSGDFEKLLELMSKVASAYKNELHKGENATPRSYLKERGITRESSLKFGIGFAPDEWDFVLKRFGKTEYDRKLLEKAGLVIRKDNTRVYDRFRGRLMFPIEDRRGRVIAFGGRIIGSGEPKYLNSPETVLFKKSNELFGIHAALTPIRQEQKVLIVEGYTDVVGLAQNGVENAVATLGTATTAYHVRELFRTAPELVFCFDGDNAGRTAAWRAMESALPMMYDGRLVSFVFLPQGHDPDSMIREEGNESFQERISGGEPIADFIFRVLLEKVDIRRHDGKAKLVEDFKPIFSKLPESSLQQLMLLDIIKHTGLDERFVRSRLSQKQQQSSSEKNVPSQTGSYELATKALAVLVQNPTFGWSVPDMNDFSILNDPNIRLLVEVMGFVAVNPQISTGALVEKFRESDHFDTIQKFVSFRHNVTEDGLEQEFQGMITKLYQRVEEQKNRNIVQKGELTQEELMDVQMRLGQKHASGKDLKT